MKDVQRPRVFVASPIYNDQCYGSYTASLLNLQRLLLESGCGFSFEWSKNVSRISQARNILSGRFLQDESATHLLFVDADMAFDANDVMRMLDYDHAIMAAIYPRKIINWERVVTMVRENPEITSSDLPFMASHYGTFNLLPGKQVIPVDEPFPIDAAGTGIMLIRRDVFIQMSKAYPGLTVRLSEEEASLFPGLEHLPALFSEMQVPDGRWLGEDISFCQRWRNMGGQIHGCAWFNVRHLGTYEYASDIRAFVKHNSSI